jgi:hypothetical protein
VKLKSDNGSADLKSLVLTPIAFRDAYGPRRQAESFAVSVENLD